MPASPKSGTYHGAVPGVKNGWYTDTATLWPGQKFSLALEVHFILTSFALGWGLSGSTEERITPK